MKKFVFISFLSLLFFYSNAQNLLCMNESINNQNNINSSLNINAVPDDQEYKVLLEESFENGKGAFSCVNTKGPLLWRDSRCKFMKVTGFVGGVKYEDEAWLISPALNLAKVTNPVELTFQHAGQLSGGKNSDLTLWISVDCVEDDIANATWKQLKIPVYMNNDNWIFVSSGVISLNDYLGKNNVRFAFKYNSTEKACATWQIRNVKVLEILEEY